MKTLTTALAAATVAALLTAAPAHAALPAMDSATDRAPSRPSSVVLFAGSGPGEIRVGWFPPQRTGSHPILRYVVKWDGASVSMSAKAKNNEVPITGLDTGRYVFRVKAVSRAGASPWAKSTVAYVE